MRVEVDKPKKEFRIRTVGNRTLYYELDCGRWLLKKVWVDEKPNFLLGDTKHEGTRHNF